MKTLSLNDLATDRRRLLAAAEAQLKHAYCPYSEFSVAAALLGTDGVIYLGANVENAAYGSTLCAERSALMSANAQGCRTFEAIAIIGRPLNGVSPEPTAPCGACRQMLFEFSELGSVPLEVIMANSDKSQIVSANMDSLLPLGFGPRNLG